MEASAASRTRTATATHDPAATSLSEPIAKPSALASSTVPSGSAVGQSIATATSNLERTVPVATAPTSASISPKTAVAPAATTLPASLQTTAIALGANVASSLYGVTGAGVKIGIISDSFDATGGAATDMANGILPKVTVLSDRAAGTDEGRAMIEIANSVAPGASYYTADGGSLADNVTALQDAGCNVIIDDLSVRGEALYQVGTSTDLAIEDAVAANVDYFTSAGNNGNDYYEQGFAPLGVNIKGIGNVVANNFGGNSPYLSLTLPTGSNRIVFQWAQPFASIGDDSAGAANSLAVYILNAAGKVVASSTTDDVGSDPSINLKFNNTSDETAFRMVVVENGGTVPDGQLFKFFLNDAIGTINSPKAGTGSGDLLGHELLPGINVLAAVPYGKTPAYGVSPGSLEPFSSVGPGTILFDQNGDPLATPIVSNEPQFAAPDATAVDAAGTNGHFSPFTGTSAAAPAAGAVGALILQADSALTTVQVTSVLAQSVIPLAAAPGFNGSGLIQARAAVEIAAADAGDRWNAAKDADWVDAARWTGRAAPKDTQAASLDDNLGAFGGTYRVTVDSAGDKAGSLAIAASAGSSVKLRITTGGDLAIGGSSAKNRTAGDLLVSDNGSLSVEGGKLTVSGSLNVNNGTVDISSGTAKANNYAQNSGSISVGSENVDARLTLTGSGFNETGGTALIKGTGVLETTSLSATASAFKVDQNATLSDSGAITLGGAATFEDNGKVSAASASFTQATFTDKGSFVTTGALNFDDTSVSVAANATIKAASLGVGSTYNGYPNSFTIAGTVTDTGDLGVGTSPTAAPIAIDRTGELDIGAATSSKSVITFIGDGRLVFTSSDTDMLTQGLNATIGGFTAGHGKLDFTKLNFDMKDSFSYDKNTGQLSLFNKTGNELASVFLDPSLNYASGFTLQADGASKHLEVIVAGKHG